MNWVLIRSWHRIVGYSRAGFAMTRCGRTVAVVGSVPPGGQAHATADALPLGDPSCESCLRGMTRDAERTPTAEDDMVAG